MRKDASVAHHLSVKVTLISFVLVLMAIPLTALAQISLPPKATHLVSGQWTSVDGKKTFLARVSVVDASHDSALARGLGFALEQAFGTLILNEIEVKNGELTMNNTLAYRSAFIQQFRILERHSEGGYIGLLLEVWVQESQLSNRVLGKSSATATIDWQSVNQQVLSFQQSRQEADLVLESVVRDFPYRAFQITLGRSEVVVDDRRIPSLRIPFRVEWNHKFLNSLEEALARISHNPKCDTWLHRDTEACLKKFHVSMSRQTAYFDDKLVMELLKTHMESDPPILLLNVLGTDGDKIYKACFNVVGLDPYQWAHQRFFQISYRSYFHERLRINSHILIPLAAFKGKSAAQLGIEVIRKSMCPERQKR